MITNLAVHHDILSLYHALLIDLRHDDLPSDCVLNLASYRSNRKQGFELDSESQCDERVLNILIQFDLSRAFADSLPVRLVQYNHSLSFIQVSPSVMHTNVDGTFTNADHLNGILQIAIFDRYDVSEECFKLLFEFNVAD